MVDYKHFDLFLKDNTDVKLNIDYSGGKVTNQELFQGSFSLEESLCSESELRFGCCEASVLKFKIGNTLTSLYGEKITPTITLDKNVDYPFAFGTYKVSSDKPTSDRKWREIEAYDAMYDILNTDVADWYNSILPDKSSTMTLKQFRTSFIKHFGLEQEEIELANDSMTVERTVEPEQLSGKDVITAICEINGCFGHIGRDGKFQYIVLPQYIQGLYPKNDLYPSNDLYPRNPRTTGIGKGIYISCTYEDFEAKSITKLQIRQEKNDIGVIVGDDGNSYIVEDNFLVYGKSSDELTQIAQNMLSVIKGVIYRPFDADVKGNPCFEVGDPVRLSTKYELVETYILKRTLKGIQALRDNLSADGVEEYGEDVNSVHTSIIQLKGKSNVLQRTIEETKSTLTDVDNQLQTQITQNAESITLEASRAKGSEEELSSKITQTATEIRSEVKDVKQGLESSISQTAAEIRSEVKDTKEGLESSISQTAESVTAEVTRAKGAEGDLSSRIALAISSIALEVSNGSETAGITITLKNENGTTSKVSGTIDMTGLVSFTDLAGNGTTTINGNNITTGALNCDLLNGGTITGQAINGGTINGGAITGGTISGTTIDTDKLTIYDKLVMTFPSDGNVNQGQTVRVLQLNNYTEPPVLKFGQSVFHTIECLCTLWCDKTFFVDGTAYFNEDIYFNKGSASSPQSRYINTYWADSSTHAALAVDSDNLTTSIGWNGVVGDTKYATKLNLRGQTVTAPNVGGVTITSDERLKEDFRSLDRYDDVYMDLEPVAFKYINGKSGRTHFGFKAGEVKEKLESHGFTTQDFAGFVQMEDNPENENYCGVDDPMGLIYTEFTAWNTHMIQKLYAENKQMHEEIETLKATVKLLAERIGIDE